MVQMPATKYKHTLICAVPGQPDQIGCEIKVEIKEWRNTEFTILPCA
jgi:hypothetical protein